MSILADLLSKRHIDESTSGKAIPPTLARVQIAATKKLNLKRRYITVAVAAVVIIGIGVAMSLRLGRVPAVPEQVARSLLPPPVVTAVMPQQNVVAPSPLQTPLQQSVLTTLPTQAGDNPAQLTLDPVPKPHKQAAVVQEQRPSMPAAKKYGSKPGSPLTSPALAGPDSAAKDALLYAARSAEQSGEWRLALADYRRALEIDPGNYKIMNNSAAALNNLGMFDEGAQEARRALDKKPDYVPAMINYAIACSSRGNNQDALRYFTAAHTADPANRNLAVNLGILQERMAKLDEAQATYLKLAEAGDALALMGLGRVYERKGNRGEAIGSYRRILSLKDATPAMKKAARERLVRLEGV